MAGYMTKMHGNIYEGELTNGAAAPVANGTLMVLGTDGKTLVLPAADTTTKLVAKEKTTIYDGIPAVRFIVNKLNANYYFVENGFEYNDCEAFDTTTYTTAVGKFLRAHPLAVGDEFVVATDKTVTLGTGYGVAATGLVNIA